MDTRIVASALSALLFTGCLSADDDPALAQEEMPLRDGSVVPAGQMMGVVQVEGPLRTCTGSLISSNTVVTSANCVVGASTVHVKFRPEPSTGLEAFSGPLTGRVRIHPDAGASVIGGSRDWSYDLATITLDAAVPGYVSPFTVHRSLPVPGSAMVVAGHGKWGPDCYHSVSSFPTLTSKRTFFDRYVSMSETAPALMQWARGGVFCEGDSGGAVLQDNFANPTVLSGVVTGMNGSGEHWIDEEDYAIATANFWPWIQRGVCAWSSQNRCNASASATGPLCDCSNRSNLLWRHQTTGDVAIWTMEGDRATSYPTVQQGVGTAWQIVGSGDFDGDRQADILWRYAHKRDRATKIWGMNGTSRTWESNPADLGPYWTVEAVADFDRNGRADILWGNTATGEHRMWMNGDRATQTKVSYRDAGANVSTSWVVKGAGDFNGDRKADIFWENTADGTTAIWFMNGSSWAGEDAPGPKGAGNVFQAMGDFNGDARADVLWRDRSGALQIWFAGGRVFDLRGDAYSTVVHGPSWQNQFVAVDGLARPAPASTDWTIDRIADFNRDGRDDLLWRSGTSMAIWYLDGVRFLGASDPRLPHEAAPHWFDPAWQTAGVSRHPGF